MAVALFLKEEEGEGRGGVNVSGTDQEMGIYFIRFGHLFFRGGEGEMGVYGITFVTIF